MSLNVSFPVRSADWKRTSRFIILSIITFHIRSIQSVQSKIWRTEALAHLEVSWVCCVPTPRTSNDGIEPRRQDTGESINRCFGGLVIWISSNTLPNASAQNDAKEEIQILTQPAPLQMRH